jgi:hypothetical protein
MKMSTKGHYVPPCASDLDFIQSRLDYRYESCAPGRYITNGRYRLDRVESEANIFIRPPRRRTARAKGRAVMRPLQVPIRGFVVFFERELSNHPGRARERVTSQRGWRRDEPAHETRVTL